MDSGNTHETQNEVVQPNDAVAADLELIEATPQAETIEPQEFYVDEEADQEQAKQGMSQAQSYAAFQKEKQKRKNKQLEIDEGTRKQAEMQATINELQATVGKITKGEPPTLESCDYDESQFQEKTREYFSSPGKQQAQEVAKPEAQKSVQDEEAEFNLYQQEQALTKDLPDYEDAKASFMNTVKTKYGAIDPNLTVAWIADISKQSGVDAAKAIFAMNKVPSLIDELNSCGKNQFAVAKVLEKAASKVKSRVKSPINTQPEPEINSTGAIDGGNEAVNKLKQQWVDNPNTHNYNLYQKAKKRKVN